MDDKKFDDIIKQKLEGYEGPSFDPSALSALHYQMAAERAIPWYMQYRNVIINGALIGMGTLVIVLSQWYWETSSATRHESEMNMMRSLIHENTPNSISPKPDTIRIVEYRDRENATLQYLTQRIANLEHELILLRGELSSNKNLAEAAISPPDQDQDQVLFKGGVATKSTNSKQIQPRSIDHKSKSAEQLHPFNLNKNGKNLSPATIRDIEAHYQKGVGIRLGPVAEVSNGFYKDGEGQLNFGYGIAMDLILSPSLSLETGLKYTRRYYEVSGQPEQITLPNVDETIGALHQSDIDYWIFDVPINLKYRYPISLKANWIAGLGFSNIIYRKQTFEYDYLYTGSGSNLTLNSSYESNDITLYSGMLNFSLGLSNKLRNNKILETSIYYQHGLEKMGLEGVQPSFLGIRGSYWFTVK